MTFSFSPVVWVLQMDLWKSPSNMNSPRYKGATHRRQPHSTNEQLNDRLTTHITKRKKSAAHNRRTRTQIKSGAVQSQSTQQIIRCSPAHTPGSHAPVLAYLLTRQLTPGSTERGALGGLTFRQAVVNTHFLQHPVLGARVNIYVHPSHNLDIYKQQFPLGYRRATIKP